MEFVEADCVAPAGDDGGGLVVLRGLLPGVFEVCVGGHGFGAVGSGRACPGIKMTLGADQYARPHWCEGRRRGLAGHISDTAPKRRRYGGCRRAQERLAAVPVGGGGAWPGFETTRRAKLAARTARGRAAAHRHTQRPCPTAGPSGARNTSIATTNVSRETSAQPPAPLPRMARKVAHLTYTVLCNFMQRMACLDSAFDQRRHPGLVRAHARAGKPPRPLVRRLRGPRT